MTTPHPPRFAERLLAWSLPDADREAVLGDLHEEFVAAVARDGQRAAVRAYLSQTVRSVVTNFSRRLRERSAREHPNVTREMGLRPMTPWFVQAVVVATLMFATFSMRLWVMVIVLAVGTPALLWSLILDPLPSPRLDQLDTVRRIRRQRLTSALFFLLFILLMSALPLNHSLWWTALPMVIADAAARWWPNDRWPIARQRDPA